MISSPRKPTDIEAPDHDLSNLSSAMTRLERRVDELTTVLAQQCREMDRVRQLKQQLKRQVADAETCRKLENQFCQQVIDNSTPPDSTSKEDTGSTTTPQSTGSPLGFSQVTPEAMQILFQELREERLQVAEMLDNVKQQKYEVIAMMHTFALERERVTAEMESIQRFCPPPPQATPVEANDFADQKSFGQVPQEKQTSVEQLSDSKATLRQYQPLPQEQQPPLGYQQPTSLQPRSLQMPVGRLLAYKPGVEEPDTPFSGKYYYEEAPTPTTHQIVFSERGPAIGAVQDSEAGRQLSQPIIFRSQSPSARPTLRPNGYNVTTTVPVTAPMQVVQQSARTLQHIPMSAGGWVAPHPPSMTITAGQVAISSNWTRPQSQVSYPPSASCASRRESPLRTTGLPSAPMRSPMIQSRMIAADVPPTGKVSRLAN